MAHNSWIRPFGVWNSNQVITHGEFALFDIGQFQSINGDLGGTWAPAAQITVGGAGMQLVFAGTSTLPNGTTITGALGSTVSLGGLFQVAASGSANFLGPAQFESTTRFDDAATFNADVVFDGTITEFANEADFSGRTNFLGTGLVQVLCNTTFDNNSTLTFINGCALAMSHGTSATLSCTTVLIGTTSTDTLTVLSHTSFLGDEVDIVGDLHIAGVLHIAGDGDLSSIITTSGVGRVVRPAAIGPASGGGSADPAVATVYWFKSGMATQTVTMLPGSDGDELEFSMQNMGNANTLTIAGGAFGPGILAMNHSGSTSGNVFNSRWKYISADGGWQLLSVSITP